MSSLLSDFSCSQSVSTSAMLLSTVDEEYTHHVANDLYMEVKAQQSTQDTSHANLRFQHN